MEHGKVQLGNITVDMVTILICCLNSFLLVILLIRNCWSFEANLRFLQSLMSWICNTKVLGGMRGMTGLLWETSLLDPDEVHFLFNLSCHPWKPLLLFHLWIALYEIGILLVIMAAVLFFFPNVLVILVLHCFYYFYCFWLVLWFASF